MKILVNCALPYANGPLHLGHIAGAYLGADIFVRFQRMSGNEVLFVSGSDEYGTPITLRADREHVTPDSIADRYHKEHTETFLNLGINFNIFSRTTAEEHSETVKEIFLELMDEGLLTEKSMIAPFCPGCNRFMPDRYITGTCPNCGFEEARGDQCDECGKILDPEELISPKCTICGSVPEFRETRHMFLRLDLVQERIMKWLDTRNFWKQNVLTFTKNFVREGLKARAITRDIEWGVPVPLKGYENKRVYVWFEALIGYISAAKIYSERIGKPDYWKSFYMDPDVRNYYFIGKDNIPFHSIVWPGMIMGMKGVNLPYEVVANEFMRFKGRQFSKSRGIGFTANEMLELTDRDYLRYYMASIMPESSDADFSPEDMAEKVNSEYIDKYGNFVHRVTSFAFNNSLDLEKGDLDEDDERMLKFADTKFRHYSDRLEKAEIKRALLEWLELVKESNIYFNNSKPWDLVKTDLRKCSSKLWVAYRLAQYMTVMIYPFTPDSAISMIGRLGISMETETPGFDVLTNEKFSLPTEKPPRPFRKIEFEDVDPNPLDLKVARILDVRDHPNADALYVLKLSLGDEERQLVAGLKKHYGTDDLRGRKIIIVANLKKAKLRGEVSEGMMLAADDGESVKYITVPDEIPDGSAVQLGDYRYNGTGTIELKTLQSLGLKVREHNGEYRISATLLNHEYFLTVGEKYATVSGRSKDGATVK